MLQGDRIFRLTFSLSLAEHMVRLLGEGWGIRRFNIQVGRRLEAGEESRSGLYALVSHKDRLLRVAMLKECAELQLDPKWRYLAEAWIEEE